MVDPRTVESVLHDVLNYWPHPCEVLAVAIVPHQAATARGAVVLWRDGRGSYADFFNQEGGSGYFQSSESTTAEEANLRFRDLCGRFWVGMPEDTRPDAQLAGRDTDQVRRELASD